MDVNIATRKNVIVEPSRSHDGAWYWRVMTDDGETYAEGEGDDSFDWAVHKAVGSFTEMSGRQNGIEPD